MQLKVFSVYDSKVEAYLPPLTFKSRGEFLRAFTETVMSDSQIAKYPGDYTAFELGSWDDSTATYDLHKTPVSLGLALEYKKDVSGLEVVKK